MFTEKCEQIRPFLKHILEFCKAEVPGDPGIDRMAYLNYIRVTTI